MYFLNRLHQKKRRAFTKKGNVVKTSGAAASAEKSKEIIDVLPTMASEPSSSQGFVVGLNDLVKSESFSLVRELVEELICDLPLLAQVEPSNSHDPMVEAPPHLPRLTEGSSSSSASSSLSSSSSCDQMESQDELDNVFLSINGSQTLSRRANLKMIPFQFF